MNHFQNLGINNTKLIIRSIISQWPNSVHFFLQGKKKKTEIYRTTSTIHMYGKFGKIKKNYINQIFINLTSFQGYLLKFKTLIYNNNNSTLTMSTTKYQPHVWSKVVKQHLLFNKLHMTKHVSIYRKILGNDILFRQFIMTSS